MKILTQLCMLALMAWAGAVQAEKPPNIVFILSDDQRFDTIAALGNEHIHTPALDSLVKRGVTFTRAYCMGSSSGAVCGPSRAMIMSGRSLFRLEGSVFNLSGAHQCLPELLREAGYTTFGTGKQHGGRPYFARGFSDGESIFFGGMGSHTKLKVNSYDEAGEYPKEKHRSLESFSSTEFADAAVGFLEGHEGDAPYFLYTAFTAPHDPRTPPQKYLDMYDPSSLPLPDNYRLAHPFNNGDMVLRDEKLRGWPRTERIVQEELATYYGMISQMDEQIGRIIEAVRARPDADNTWIIFTSDHGLAIGSHGLLGKQNLYDHSMRVPMVIVGPGVEPGSKRDEFIYLFDLMPTMLELGQARVPVAGEARSIAPLLRDDRSSPAAARGSIFTAYRDIQRAVRTDRWKLITYPKVNVTQLFDLQSDPAETRNLADDPVYEQVLDRMWKLLEAQQEHFGDSLPLRADEPADAAFDYEAAEQARKGG